MNASTTYEGPGSGALNHLASLRKEASAIANLADRDRPAAESAWPSFAQKNATACWAAFVTWEAAEADRLVSPMDQGLRLQALTALAKGDRELAAAIVKVVLADVAGSVSGLMVDGPEMAFAICRLAWQRDFAAVLQYRSGASCVDHHDPYNVAVPNEMWGLISTPRPPNVPVFEPAFLPLLANVIWLKFAQAAPDQPPIRTIKEMTSAKQSLPVGLCAAQIESWAHDVMTGIVCEPDGIRPGLIALMWAIDLGLLEDLLPMIVKIKV